MKTAQQIRKEKHERLVEIILLMIRCEYIDLKDGLCKSLVTKKGKGVWPTPFYRGYNNVMCAISQKHKQDVIAVLEFIKNSNVTNN